MIYILMRFDDDFAIEIDSVWDSREQAESHAEYLRVSEDQDSWFVATFELNVPDGEVRLLPCES